MIHEIYEQLDGYDSRFETAQAFGIEKAIDHADSGRLFVDWVGAGPARARLAT